ncbi:MAG: LAGLIDADG family homing endonuclease [Romboutsia timonensis]
MPKKVIISIEKQNKMLKMYNDEKKSIKTISKEMGYSVSIVYRQLKELNYVPRTNREQALKYSFNENYFQNIDSEHKAYWLGYICADATIYDKTNTDSGILKIETKKEDEEIVQKFKKDIESSHPIKHYQNKHFEGYECSRLVLKSNIIIKNLQLYGIGSHKSLTLQFPNDIKQSQFVNAFIRGYFDGDGSLCLYKNGVFDIKILGTKTFLEDIKSIVGIQCRISNPKSNIYELRISKNSERKKFLTFIYKDATIYLQRKYDRYNLFMQKY